MKNTIKYVATHVQQKTVYLSTYKVSLTKHIGTSVDTIRRREATESSFYINGWLIYTDVEVHKQPKRNTNALSVNNPL